MAQTTTTERGTKKKRPPNVRKFPAPQPQKPEPDPPIDEPEPEFSPDTAAEAAEMGNEDDGRPFISQEPFPMPPRPSIKGGYCDADAGMDWWRALPEPLINRSSVFIYREWPILDRLQELSPEDQAAIASKRKKPPTKNIDTPARPFGPDTRMEFLTRYGSGAYKVYINDAGVKGKRNDPELGARNLCRFVIKVHDSDYPPVLDPSRPDKGLAILDLKHPENQSYITQLRMAGVLQFDRTGAGAGDSMSSDVLAGTVKDLAGQITELREDKLFNRLRDEMGKHKNGDAEGGAVTVKLLELMIAMQTKPAPAPPDTTAPLIQLFQTQIATLTQELRDERNERRKTEQSIRDRANQPPPDPFQFLERTVATLETARKVLAPGSTGGLADTAVRHASRMSGTLEFLSEIIPKIAESPIMNAIAVKLTASAAGTGSMPPGVAPAAPGTNTATGADAELRFINDVITPVMLNYLEDDATGADFAEWVWCGFPNRLQSLQSRGPAVIVATYQATPLWPRLATREQQFRSFAAEFCAWRPATEDEETERPTRHTAAETNGAAANAPIFIDFDEPLEGEPIEGRVNP